MLYLLAKEMSYFTALWWKLISLEENREVLKEERYQGNELKAKLEELFNQELLRQERIRKDEERERIRKDEERERIRQHELEQAKKRKALELKRIHQARLCN